MALSTSQMRAQHGAPCKVKNWPGAQEAWDALSAWLEYYGYELRQADTGSRACRPITGGTNYSLHAYFLDVTIWLWNLRKHVAGGLAADFNWQTNPYGPRLVTDMLIRKDGILMPDRIEGIRTNNGKQVFRWGGYYSGNKDAMHYELVCAAADLATGIDPTTLPTGNTPGEEEDMGKLRKGDQRPEWWVLTPEGKRYIPTTGHAVVGHREGLWDLPTPKVIEQAFIDELPTIVTEAWITKLVGDLLGEERASRDTLLAEIRASNPTVEVTPEQVAQITSVLEEALTAIAGMSDEEKEALAELTADKVIEEIAS